MSFTQTWVISGRSFTPAPCGLEHIRSELHPPYSLAFFCPVCGEVWARRIISPATRWNVITHECSKHAAPRYCEPEGSIWLNYNQDYLNHLPREILHHEALLRIKETLNDN